MGTGEVTLPELLDVVPYWFDTDYGPKLGVDKSALEVGIFRIASKVASVEIMPMSGGKWLLKWKVVYAPEEWTEGHLLPDTNTLMSMFGLAPEDIYEHETYRYVRVGRCLNIPTKYPPSISVYLDSEDEIRSSLLKFIEDNS